MNEPNPLTDAGREQLVKAQQKLAVSQQCLFAAQCAVSEAIEAVDCLLRTDAAESETPIERTHTHVFGRDSHGAIMAADREGKVLYKSSDTNTFIAPFTLWLCDGEGVISKKFIDEPDTWLIEHEKSI